MVKAPWQLIKPASFHAPTTPAERERMAADFQHEVNGATRIGSAPCIGPSSA